MYITILTTGSLGDVQPFLALALGLREAGYQVRIATHEQYRDIVTGRGIEFRPVGGDVRLLLESEEGRRLLDSGGNGLLALRQLARMAEPLAVRATRDAFEAVRDADLMIVGTPAFFGGEALAEATGIPVVYAGLGPMAPTREAPSMLFPALPAGLGWMGRMGYHQLTHQLTLLAFAGLMRHPMNRARGQALGLGDRGWIIPRRRFREGPLVLYGYSEAVLPRPRDWSSTQQVTGYWFLDRGTAWEPSARLLDFLGSGPPPVCVGFGSMNDRDPRGLAELAVDALRRAGQRGILLTGWGGLASEQRWDDVFVLDQAPHDWLFLRTAAVVHHGGAGTTAAGLRAGRPTVVVPYRADQPFWGRRVFDLGAGPKPLPRRRLTAEGLAEAIFHAVSRPELRAAADRVARRLRQEDGVGRAVALVERLLGGWQERAMVAMSGGARRRAGRRSGGRAVGR
jgi:UDP:flavonoid glycosyltransferase YjiC (YdhE family)